MSLKRKFRAWQKDHYNFMTPAIEKLWSKGDMIIELSRGAPFLGMAIRGVTVYHGTPPSLTEFTPVDPDLNKAFSGEDWQQVEQEATTYAEQILHCL